MQHSKLPDFFKESVRQKKKVLLQNFPNLQAAAFLDFDGSLIDGDITEGKKTDPGFKGLLDRILERGALPGFVGPDGASKFWYYYENTTSPMEAWVWAATLISNLPPEEDAVLKSCVRQHLGHMLDKFLFSFTHDLLDFCREEKIVPYIVSASPHYFIEELGEFLPIESKNLFGLNGKKNKMTYVDSNPHDHAGKAKRVLDLCKTHPISPLLAMGNKWRWDGGMIRTVCENGGVGLLVNEGVPKDFSHPALHCLSIA